MKIFKNVDVKERSVAESFANFRDKIKSSVSESGKKLKGFISKSGAKIKIAVATSVVVVAVAASVGILSGCTAKRAEEISQPVAIHQTYEAPKYDDNYSYETNITTEEVQTYVDPVNDTVDTLLDDEQIAKEAFVVNKEAPATKEARSEVTMQYSNGRPKLVVYYDESGKQVKCERYQPSGNLDEIYEYNPNGTFKSIEYYLKDGNEKKGLAGTAVAQKEWYDSNGTIVRSQSVDVPGSDVVKEVKYENGKKVSEKHTIDGRVVDSWYIENGDHFYYSVVDGKEFQPWKSITYLKKNDELVSQTTQFKDGKVEKLVREDDGKVIEKHFDENGKLTSSREFGHQLN